MTATDRLVIWLRAQLTEDERLAPTVHGDGCVLFTYEWQKDCDCEYPARALADVKAKRAIIAGYEESYRLSDDYPGWEGAIWLLAQPYAGRDGWQPEWSVTT